MLFYTLGFFGAGQRMVQNEPGALIGPIATIFGFIIDFVFNIIYNLTIYNSLGLSIILLTIIVRTLMLPLGIKSQKSMMAMQKLAPEMNKIKEKYSDKSKESQQAMNAEIQKLYADNKVNPLGGCLPMVIQMPLFFGLSFIMHQSHLYVSRLGQLYSQISNFMINLVPGYANYLGIVVGRQVEGYTDGLDIVAGVAGRNIIPNNMTLDVSNTQDLNRLLNAFTAEDWNVFFGNMPEVYKHIPAEHLQTLLAKAPVELINVPVAEGSISAERLRSLQQLGEYVQNLLVQHPIPQEYLMLPTLADMHQQKMAIETFFGMVLTEATGIGWPGIMIPFLAVTTALLTSWVSMKASAGGDEKAKQQQRMMMVIMPVMMGAMTIGLPAGVGIFWITSSVYQIGQQLVINRINGIPLFSNVQSWRRWG